MSFSARQFSFGTFLVTTLSFFLPFATLSCAGGQRSLTGVELAIGSSVNNPAIGGPPIEKRIPRNPLALSAFIVAAAGAIAARRKELGTKSLATACASLGGVLLLMLRSTLADAVRTEGMGLVQVRFEAGYWIAFLGFMTAFLTLFFLVPDQQTAQAEGAPVAHGSG